MKQALKFTMTTALLALSFAPGLRSALALGMPNMLVLRSMTKDYALAGLRLGYAVAPQSLAAALAAVLPPWNVNALAQAAGIAALAEKGYLARLNELPKLKADLAAGLAAKGYQFVRVDELLEPKETK